MPKSILPDFSCRNSIATLACCVAQFVGLWLLSLDSGCLAAESPTLKINAPIPASRDRSVGLLCNIAKSTLERHFGGAHSDKDLPTFVAQMPVPDQYRRAAGLFVTISENGHTRACWGSLEPKFADLVRATVFTTEQALNDEYRFAPIKSSELPFLNIQVTVINKVEPLSNIAEQNPRLCGMLVKSGGKSGVILPGETADPYYQMLKCKLKAGIKPGEPCLVYRIKADVNK
jgi:AMMECR1 domain-containing protein